MNDPTSLHDAFNGRAGRGEQSETDEFNEIQHLRFLLKETKAELERTREALSTANRQIEAGTHATPYLAGGVP